MILTLAVIPYKTTDASTLCFVNEFTGNVFWFYIYGTSKESHFDLTKLKKYLL